LTLNQRLTNWRGNPELKALRVFSTPNCTTPTETEK